MKKCSIVLLSILVLSILSFPNVPLVFASPDDTTFYVIADASPYEIGPDTVTGSFDYMIINTKSSANNRAILKFDISSLDESADISVATLRVRCNFIYQLVGGVTDIEARRVADDSWVEGEVTWNNLPAYGIVEDTIVPSDAWLEWDITAYTIIEFADNGVISVILRCVVEDYDSESRQSHFRSREYDSGSLKAELYVEYSVVSDNAPFYSNVNYDDKTQVGLSADFWCFWEDDLALDTCYFWTNNTGTGVNHTLSVSGVSSWANKTLQLNFTEGLRVEWKWFAMDNASQWNSTSVYFLVTTSLYVTFNLNNSTMGNFYVDGVLRANETMIAYNYNQSINLVGGSFDDFSFLNFTWLGGSSVVNNYDYLTSGNNTVWCYFQLVSDVAPSNLIYAALTAAIIAVSLILIWKKKE